MAKIRLSRNDKRYLKSLGKELKQLILQELEYKSLDKFALEHHDFITKPTLYAICAGERDFQFSTISGLSKALNINPITLLKKVEYQVDFERRKT